MATKRLDLTPLFSPAEIAKSRGVNVTKVLTWINSGELKAVNYAAKLGGLPRWKVSASALEDFERLRQSGPLTPKVERRPRTLPKVKDYIG